MSLKINIAIDGPAGAGKSTVARKVARQLGYIYIDTGAMYRAIALQVLRSGINIDNQQQLDCLLNQVSISLSYTADGEQMIFLNGADVSREIRTAEVSALASPVSQKQAVRSKLVHMQQELARDGGVVMDGRDIGSNVLPNAECKIFLTADLEERARRRFLEMQDKGHKVVLEQLQQDILQRDKNDQERDLNPLLRVADACLVDTTNMSLAEVVETVVQLAQKALAAQKLSGVTKCR